MSVITKLRAWLPSSRVALSDDKGIPSREMYGWMNQVSDQVDSLVIQQPGTGTVTSVDVNGGSTGLTASGGPVTTAGAIALGGVLNQANGGTGSANPVGLTTSTPATVALSGAFPNQVIAVAAGGGGSGQIQYETAAQRVPNSTLLKLYDTSGTTAVATIGPNGTYGGAGFSLNRPSIFPSGRGSSVQLTKSGVDSVNMDLGISNAIGGFYVEVSFVCPPLPANGQVIYLRYNSGGGPNTGGVGFGYGLNDYETSGSKWIGLQEAIAWKSSNITATAGPHVLSVYTDGGDIIFSLDGRNVVQLPRSSTALGTGNCCLGAGAGQPGTRAADINVQWVYSYTYSPNVSFAPSAVTAYTVPAIAMPRWESWISGY